jgi:uncharacterized protein (TIGR04255 family)
VMAKYARPPITESALELRFGSPFTLREIERLKERFKRRYPAIDEQKQVDVRIEPTGVATNSKLAGYKMTAANACDILLIHLSALGTVRVAPYDGWEHRLLAAQENFDIMTKIADRSDIVRLGARYINRIDLPKSAVSGMSTVSFLRVGVAIPRELSTTVGPYSLSVSFKESSTGANILIQSAIIQPAPLIDHVSLLLDIDASIDSDIPTRLEAVWSLTEKLREAKNKVFEACITDHARKLFG